MLWLMLLSSFVVFSHGCKCKVPSITESYCAADIVARVTVLKVYINGTSQTLSPSKYKVEYIKKYKETKKFDTVQCNKFIHTAPTGGSCGVFVDIESKDTDWIFFGTVNDKKISINSCGGSRPWSKDIKNELKTISPCDCKGQN